MDALLSRDKQIKIVAALVVLLFLTVGGFWLNLKLFAEAPMAVADTGMVYMVKPGQGFIRVANELEKLGVIDDAGDYIWYARLTGQAHHIKVGEYEIQAHTSPAQFLDDLVTGRVKQYSLTIVEGWNFNQLMQAIRGHEYLQQTLVESTTKQIMEKLGLAGEHPEGRFFPDTYSFPLGTTDIAFLQRAYEAMEKVLAEQWQQREVDLPYKTPYEALIMASIVEKETGVVEEREQIAGVFVRRLQSRMRLQTDPTVIYGMGDLYKGNIRRADLKRDTPYNTYTRRGLPPTPIAMPGRAAIYAALHPDDGDTLYFVAKGDGSHYFSVTVKEHNQAVNKYQRFRRRKDYRSVPTGD
ncbi:MAG: endolytic transglycosylase MltG [Gammaproteobacteria bacterium]|nr:endolytic transglycosylase MltG [Gammaproteobacteria bacterium]MDH5727760.1 endolytic transglycosylase MltG [Gammaproteobacteria bacterium]